MSKNRLSLLRTIHKLSQQQQPIITSQPQSSKQSTIKKSYAIGIASVIGVAIAFWNIGVKQVKLTEQEKKMLEQNEKQTIREGMNMLRQKYSQ